MARSSSSAARCAEILSGEKIGEDSMAASRAIAHKVKPETTAEFDAIVIGAGVSGLYQLYKLRELDLRLLVFSGTARRVGLGGTLRRTARDRTLSELCRQQIRSAS